MNKTVKITGLALGGLGLSGLLLFGVAEFEARSRLHRKFETHRTDLPLPSLTDVAAIERGKHLVEARYGCASCHGQDLSGGVMLDEPAIGTLRAPNLTGGKGGRTSAYTMTDWDRIVRHGVKPDGSAAVMPSDDFFKMSDAELSDIVAYVRAAPPVDAEVAAPTFGPVGKVLLAVGKFPLSAEHQPDPSQPHALRPPEAENTAAFGAHLAATCTGCHRSNLAGGAMPFGPPEWPPAGNLTPHASGLRDWSYEDFERAITEGVGKDGRLLREPMSAVVQGTKAMLPAERKAIWTYLRTVSPARTNG